MADETDYAYAAGIIDGDGCIGVYKNKAKSCKHGYRYCLSIRVQMREPEPILWLKLTFGGHFHEYRNQGWGNSNMYCWGMDAKKALAFLQRTLPYFKAKAKQVELAIQFQEQKLDNGYNYHKNIPTAVLEAEGILAMKISQLKRRSDIAK